MSFKPNISHVMLVGSPDNDKILFAFSDKHHTNAFRKEPMRSHLYRLAEAGITIIIVVNEDRYVMTKGRPVIKMTEGQLAELSDGSQIRIGSLSENQAMFLEHGIPDTSDKLLHLATTTAGIPYENFQSELDKLGQFTSKGE
jgi:hypothetical protein